MATAAMAVQAVRMANPKPRAKPAATMALARQNTYGLDQ